MEDNEVRNLIYAEATDTPLNTVYSIFIALWSTCLMESWKRKEAFLGDAWLVRDDEINREELATFRCTNIYSLDTKYKDKMPNYVSWYKNWTFYHSMVLSMLSAIFLTSMYLVLSIMTQIFQADDQIE